MLLNAMEYNLFIRRLQRAFRINCIGNKSEVDLVKVQGFNPPTKSAVEVVTSVFHYVLGLGSYLVKIRFEQILQHLNSL